MLHVIHQPVVSKRRTLCPATFSSFRFPYDARYVRACATTAKSRGQTQCTSCLVRACNAWKQAMGAQVHGGTVATVCDLALCLRYKIHTESSSPTQKSSHTNKLVPSLQQQTAVRKVTATLNANGNVIPQYATKFANQSANNQDAPPDAKS